MKYYKKLAHCKMCRKRFVVRKSDKFSQYTVNNYCPVCRKKYEMNKVKVKDQTDK